MKTRMIVAALLTALTVCSLASCKATTGASRGIRSARSVTHGMSRSTRTKVVHRTTYDNRTVNARRTTAHGDFCSQIDGVYADFQQQYAPIGHDRTSEVAAAKAFGQLLVRVTGVPADVRGIWPTVVSSSSVPSSDRTSEQERASETFTTYLHDHC